MFLTHHIVKTVKQNQVEQSKSAEDNCPEDNLILIKVLFGIEEPVVESTGGEENFAKQ